MKKKVIILSLLIIVVMILLPLASIFFVPSDVGMSALLLLLFVANPLASLFVGGISGANIKRLWFFPFVCTLAFLAFALLIFKMDLEGCTVYSIGYLTLGIISMFVSHFISKYKIRK